MNGEKTKGRPQLIHVQDMLTMQRRYASGESSARIAKDLGVSTKTVWRMCKDVPRDADKPAEAAEGADLTTGSASAEVMTPPNPPWPSKRTVPLSAYASKQALRDCANCSALPSRAGCFYPENEAERRGKWLCSRQCYNEFKGKTFPTEGGGRDAHYQRVILKKYRALFPACDCDFEPTPDDSGLI